MKFQQRDLETASDWDTLTPGSTAEYAWDEPMAAHRLRVVLESATEAFRDAPVQEYNLDDIKVWPAHNLCIHQACLRPFLQTGVDAAAAMCSCSMSCTLIRMRFVHAQH